MAATVVQVLHDFIARFILLGNLWSLLSESRTVWTPTEPVVWIWNVVAYNIVVQQLPNFITFIHLLKGYTIKNQELGNYAALSI